MKRTGLGNRFGNDLPPGNGHLSGIFIGDWFQRHYSGERRKGPDKEERACLTP